ncbi:TLDc domain-containing protein [Entamoeba marina]
MSNCYVSNVHEPYSINEFQSSYFTQDTSDNFKPILSELQNLQTWSGFDDFNLIYDSDLDGFSNAVFVQKVLNHPNLYFINIDDHMNVFGCFMKKGVTKPDHREQDNDHFIFSLCTNSLSSPKQSPPKNGQRLGVCLFEHHTLYSFGNASGCVFFNPNTKLSGSDLGDTYEFLSNNDLIGNREFFQSERIIVVQMY